MAATLAAMAGASSAHAASVEAEVVAAVVAYGEHNLNQATGLVKDSIGDVNLAESSCGYYAALLIQGGHAAQAHDLLTAILANQDTRAGSETKGCFRWYGSEDQPFSYDATLYVVPPLAWSLRNYRQQLGDDAEVLAKALNQAVVAIQRHLVGPESEAYLMLQAAAQASAGAALDQPGWVAGAQSQVRSWLSLVKSQGLPQGHSPTFDSIRMAALLWVQSSLQAPSPEVTEAWRLMRADACMRLWMPARKLAGAIYRSYPSDYLRSPGVVAYVLSRYFGIGTIEGVEPFAMYFLLPAGDLPMPPPAPALPYQVDTRATGTAKVEATSTYVAAEFSLGTMSGTIQDSSVPILICLAEPDATPTIYSQSYPATAHVSAVQSGGLALCSFDFDDVGQASRRQAYVKLILGSPSEVEAVYLRGGEWNHQPTGVGQLEAIAVETRGCYVGLIIGRCGPAEAAIERRVKPGDLHWAGEGPLSRLVLTVYGRQQDYALQAPLQDVRVVLGVGVVPQSQYPSLAEFGAEFARSRVKQEVEAIKQRIDEEGEHARRSINEGIIPDPKPKKDIKYRYLLKHSVELQALGRTLQLTEDLRADQLLGTTVDGSEVAAGSLWTGPGFAYEPGADLVQALAAAGY